MSSHPPSNDNLSAYFDHEVSPEELCVLESLLENSPEARQELHELGEISRLLQETATEPAPPELASSIRRRIEQETLLAETVPSTVERVPSLLRYRIAVAISACSSVAALILFILLMNIPNPSRSFETADRSILANTPQPDTDATVMSRELATADPYRVAFNESQKPGIPDRRLLTAPVPPVALHTGDSLQSDKQDHKEALVASKSRAGKLMSSFSFRNSVAEKEPATDPPQRAMGTEPQSSKIPSDIPLDTIRIGDVIPYFRDIDGKIAVIEVRVVDVKQALGTMELLLARNDIPVNQQKQSEVEDQLQNHWSLKSNVAGQKDRSDQDTDDSENELFAVYVEATETQLATALQDFQKDLKRDQLVGLALQPAINASSLTEQVKELPQLLTQRTFSPKAANATVEAKSVRALDRKKASVATGGVAGNLPFKQSTTANPPTRQSMALQEKRPSYQTLYRMQIPAEEQEKLVQQTIIKQPLSRKFNFSAEQPLVASKPASGLITDKAFGLNETNAPVIFSPVKVLLVFKSTAIPTTVPASH